MRDDTVHQLGAMPKESYFPSVARASRSEANALDFNSERMRRWVAARAVRAPVPQHRFFRSDSLKVDMDVKALKARTPAISSILSGAFHQDWQGDWDSAEDVWRTAIDHAPSQQIPQLDADSALLIEHLHTDADVLRFISLNASGFSPQLDVNQEPRGWLRTLHAQVQTRTDREGAL